MKIFGLEARKPFPAKVTVDINTQCNAKCVICPYPQIRTELKHGVMEWGLYQKITDDYANICYSNRIMGELSYCNMSEPTLVHNLPEFIKYARDKGCFTIYFNTNGSNLKPKLIDTFIKEKTYPAIHLNIMVFSKERYQKIMGLDFDLLKENLRYLLKKYPHSLIDIGFFTPLMKADEVGAAKEFFKDTKAVLHLAKDISDRASNVYLPQGLASAGIPKPKKRLLACSKNRPIHRMHINYDGRAYLCDQDMRLETDFGNVRDNTIEEVWNGKKIMDALDIIYGKAQAGGARLPCFKCEYSVDDENIKILRDPSDYKPRKLFGPLKRWVVKRGWAVIKKRGRLALS